MFKLKLYYAMFVLHGKQCRYFSTYKKTKASVAAFEVFLILYTH